MNFTLVSYRSRLKDLSIKYPWIIQHHVKPMPGHVDLVMRLLGLCEMAMNTPSPVFSVFRIRYLENCMKITAIPSPDTSCDSTALRQAINLTLGEANIVCPHCGEYQSIGEILHDAYVCCPASGDLVLWETIRDIMAMQPKEKDTLFEIALMKDTIK